MSLSAHLLIIREEGFTLDIAAEIEAGRTLALLGPNGAGKSTAVSALAGLLRLDGGRIVLGGRVLDDAGTGVFVPPEERNIGVVFQDYALFPHLSVEENVGFGLASRKQPRDEVGERTRRWLGRLGLVELAARKARDLSGGEAQKVALARALITEPDLLVLDEPLSSLDATTRVELRHQLADHLSGFPGPRLLITHDPTEAFLLGDEICVVEAGVVTQTGSADDIRLRPRTRYAADLAGVNLLTGLAQRGEVEVDGHTLRIADSSFAGEVLLTINPRAVTLHLQLPEGSARNVWRTEVARIEHFGDRVRLQTMPPMPLTVEVTPAAVTALSLSVGSPVWLSVKATEIGVAPL